MMKKIFYLFSLLTIFCGLASCSDSKDDPAPGITGEFTCNTESLSFPMQGGRQSYYRSCIRKTGSDPLRPMALGSQYGSDRHK